MTAPTTLISAMILLPLLGFVVWLWYSVDKVEKQLRPFTSFEGIHFEV